MTLDRGDKLAEHKVFFARSDNEGKQYKTLEEVIELAKRERTVALGLCWRRPLADLVLPPSDRSGRSVDDQGRLHRAHGPEDGRDQPSSAS